MENNIEVEKIEPAVKPRKENDAKVPQRDKKHSRENKSRKKDIKGVEQILKGFGPYENVEDKLSAIYKRYTEILDENRKHQQTIKQIEKKFVMIQREKDQIYAERNKAFLTKSNLESLCRELQKQNKSVKEESLLKIREEEEKRKEVSTTFQNTLAEITALMNQNNEENEKLLEDKMELTKKFNIMHEQMERFERLHKEIKLEMIEEKEALLKEKQQLLMKLAEYHVQVQEHQATEAKLRSKISMYNDKYDEFQNALTKSNEMFGGFNEEMEKMSKKILKLEKETSVWKQRWENTHSSLLEVTADRKAKDTEIATLNRKCSLLQELCRGFQQERATLIGQLKEKNRNESETSEDKNNIADKMAQLSNNRKELQNDLEALCQKNTEKQSNLNQTAVDKSKKQKKTTNSDLSQKNLDSNKTNNCDKDKKKKEHQEAEITNVKTPEEQQKKDISNAEKSEKLSETEISQVEKSEEHQETEISNTEKSEELQEMKASNADKIEKQEKTISNAEKSKEP